MIVQHKMLFLTLGMSMNEVEEIITRKSSSVFWRGAAAFSYNDQLD